MEAHAYVDDVTPIIHQPLVDAVYTPHSWRWCPAVMSSTYTCASTWKSKGLNCVLPSTCGLISGTHLRYLVNTQQLQLTQIAPNDTAKPGDTITHAHTVTHRSKRESGPPSLLNSLVETPASKFLLIQY